MKSLLLPHRPFPARLDLALARSCAQMIQHAYAMFAQWDGERPPIRDFRWRKPAPPGARLTYGEPLWATYRYARLVRPGNPRLPPTHKWEDRDCPVGFLATAPGRIYVIFRGTQTYHEWMKVNFKFVLKDCDYDRFSKGRAHEGFLAYYRTLRQTLESRLSALHPEGKEVVFAGHSLGGAMSTLAVLDAAEEGYEGASFTHVNFGTPRVFDPVLAAYYESLPITTFRFVNVEDVVTTVPPPNLNRLDFQHVGTPLSFSAHYGSIAANHHMDNYRYALDHPGRPQRA